MFPILIPPPSSLPIPSLWVVPVHQPQASSSVHRTWTGNSFHTWYFTCFNAILPNLPTLSLSCRVHKTVLYISVSLSLFSEFVRLLESVGLHLLPTWGSFSHYFFEYIISLTLFLLSIWILMTWVLEFCCNLIGAFGSSSYLYFFATNFSYSICFQHCVIAHQSIYDDCFKFFVR